jgi:hypothetical protein
MTPGLLELVGDDLTLTTNVSPDEFLDGALAILTAAIGKLPPEQQEAALADLEDGKMRRRVTFFVERCAALEQLKRLQ